MPKKPKVRPTRYTTLQLYREMLKAQSLEEDDDASDDTEDEDDTTFDGGVADRYVEPYETQFNFKEPGWPVNF